MKNSYPWHSDKIVGGDQDFEHAASSAAERFWMRPKPAMKRASRGRMRQKEKSESSKLMACSGKRASHRRFKSGCSPSSICALPLTETLLKVKGSERPSSASAIDSAT